MPLLNKKISVVAPVFNEEAVVEEFYNRMKKVLEEATPEHEIIFVDDGSSDSTLEKLKNLHNKDAKIKVLSFSRNFGHLKAVSAGLEFSSGDAVMVIDSDLQDPPEVLFDFLKKWQEGYKVIYGIRTKRKEWFLKRFAYWAFYRLFKKLASLKDIPVDAGEFSLLDKQVVDIIKSLPERSLFLRGLRIWVGFKHCGVVYERSIRFAGKTKYPIRKLVKLAADNIFSFSFIPLKIATMMGFIVAFIDFLIILIVLYLRLVYGVIGVPGFSSTIIAIFFIGGVQLISLGILGEYVARIYEEVRHRPRYVVKEKIGL